MPRRLDTLAIPLLALALGLAACGGSGGGGSGGSTVAALSAGSSGGSTGSAFVPAGSGMDPEMAFEQTVYPLVTLYCAGCHDGGGPGFPDFAHLDLGTAYRAVVDTQKANFADPTAVLVQDR